MILYRYMRKIARKIGVVLGIIGVVGLSLGILAPVPTAGAFSLKEGEAKSECEKNLFGMRPWYAGLAVKSESGACVVGTPATDADIPTFTLIVVLNITADVMVATGYLALAFIIYGGYLYLLSGGDAAKVAKGKKALTGAIIGLVIILLASAIVNFILGIISK